MAPMDYPRFSLVLSTHQAQFEAVAFKGDFEANISKIAAWGYDGVELAIRNPRLVDVELLEKALAVYRLQVPAIGTGQAWGEERLSFTDPNRQTRDAAVSRIKDQIQLAQRLKAMVIIGLIRGITPPGQSKQASMQYFYDCLKECAEAAADRDVRLALEPLNRYETDLIQTVHEGLEFIDRIDSSSIGLLLDTFHMNIEEVSIEESIRMCGGHIFHFHVADSNRWFPGAGHLDFASIFEVLQATGYQGWISGEFMPMPDADIAAQESLKYLRQLFPMR